AFAAAPRSTTTVHSARRRGELGSAPDRRTTLRPSPRASRSRSLRTLLLLPQLFLAQAVAPIAPGPRGRDEEDRHGEGDRPADAASRRGGDDHDEDGEHAVEQRAV